MAEQLSSKPIPVDERLIFALNTPDHATAKRLVAHLADAVYVYKIGPELCMSGSALDLIDWLRGHRKRVCCDLKLYDTAETAGRTLRQLKKHGVEFVTVHASDAVLAAAAQESERPKILAVTAPTTQDRSVLQSLGSAGDLVDLALARARNALQKGCDGVFSSGLETGRLYPELGDHVLMVYPDLQDDRPDQGPKPPMALEQEFASGADYVVVGRQIKNAQDPRAKAEEIQDRIENIFGAEGRATLPHIT